MSAFDIKSKVHLANVVAVVIGLCGLEIAKKKVEPDLKS